MRKLIVAAVFLLSAFPVFAADDFSNFVVAKVNNKAITDSEVSDRYRFVTVTSKINIKDPSEKKILRQQIIDKMVDEELIRQDAKVLKIELGEKELKEGIEMVANQQKQSLTQFKSLLQRNGISFENYSYQIEAEILWSKIIVDTLRSKVRVSEVEVSEFLEQHKLNANSKQFFLNEILISPSENAEKFATKLSEELRRGADFKTIAEQFSSSLSQEIGWVSQGDIDPKIYAAISKIGKGGYTDPVKLSDGFHIFKLLDTKHENKLPEKDLTAAKNIISSRKLQTMAKGYLMDLRKRAFVEIKN